MKFSLYVIVILLLSSVVRFVGLGWTGQVVFDEVHFGKFISSYCCTHQRFFDIHPPIGKLLIAGGVSLAGYDGGFSFDHIGQAYDDVPIAGMRIVPALAGAILPLIIMLLLRQAGVSKLFSFLGGCAVALDNALIVESRFIVTDSILLLATFGSIAAAIGCVQSKRPFYSWMLVILAGVLAGVAVGTKFTGLVGGGLSGLVLFVQLFRSGYKESGVWAVKLLVLSGVAIGIYLVGWMLHFSLLNLPGSGDVWGIPTGSFWNDLVRTHQQMLSANYNLTASHPYGSPAWSWPLMKRSVFYWQGGANQFIYLLGNPAVWWGGAVIGVTAIISFLWGLGTKQRFNIAGIALLFVLGYVLSYGPLLRVPRVLFLYHYMTPLLFSLLFAVWWVDWAYRSGRAQYVVSGLSLATVLLPIPDWWFQFIPAWIPSLATDSSQPVRILWYIILIIGVFLILNMLVLKTPLKDVLLSREFGVTVLCISTILGFLIIAPLTYGTTVPKEWGTILFRSTSWR
jgi:dolichyl-phosphate-mannose--protein O-mannosyl transferase